MACFIVPGIEAVVVTAAEEILRNKYKKEQLSVKIDTESHTLEKSTSLPFYKKLQWLMALLWGGVVLLAFEHVWHGEVVPWFPFLTAAENKEDTLTMLHEMSTVGVTMALLVTAVWIGMLFVSHSFEKRISSSTKVFKETK